MARGLLRQGPTLLLAPLAAAVDVVGREHTHDGLSGQLAAEEVVPRHGRGGACAVMWGGRQSRSRGKGGLASVGA